MNPESYAKWVCPEYLHEIAAQYSNRLMNIESLGADINANLCAFVISELGHSINIWVNSSKTDKKKKKVLVSFFFFPNKCGPNSERNSVWKELFS